MKELLDRVEALERQCISAETIYDETMLESPNKYECNVAYDVWQQREKELKRAYVLLTRALIKKAASKHLT